MNKNSFFPFRNTQFGVIDRRPHNLFQLSCRNHAELINHNCLKCPAKSICPQHYFDWLFSVNHCSQVLEKWIEKRFGELMISYAKSDKYRGCGRGKLCRGCPKNPFEDPKNHVCLNPACEESVIKDVSLKPYHGTGRNEKCPCGSGLKYKKCCGK